MYTLETTSRFIKTAAKFFKRHPELKNRFELLVEALCHDPFQNRLRLHPLKSSIKYCKQKRNYICIKVYNVDCYK